MDFCMAHKWCDWILRDEYEEIQELEYGKIITIKMSSRKFMNEKNTMKWWSKNSKYFDK